MKRISVFLAFLILLMLAFSSCRKNDSAPQNSGAGSGGGENIPSEDTGDEEWYYSSDKEIRIVHSLGLDSRASEIGEAIFEASGVSATVCSDSAGEREYEIVIGECNRAISKEAYSLLKDKIEKDERDSGYLIYSDGSSIALAYIGRAEEILQEEAANFFIESCVYEDFVLSSGTLCYYGFDLIEELDERDELIAEQDWARFSNKYGEDLAVALRQLYSCYDDNIVDWLANLYDADIGGFYFSNSARNYNGFLPDLESTVQALGFIASSGMAKSYDGSSSYADVIPEEMAEQIIGFVKGLQSSNGYFYHPQWGRELTDSRLSRRGRDLTWATNILREFGVSPIYDTPNGVKGSGVESMSGVTAPLSSSKVSSVSKVILASSDYVPEHLLNKTNFEKYLSSLKLTTDSYTVGNELSSQISQIIQRDKALVGEGYSLVDILISWLNQNQNPATGTWDYLNPGDENYSVFRGMDGLFKILNIYNAVGAELPHAKEAIESTKYCIDVDVEANIVCDVYNTWYTLDLIFDNLNKYSSNRESGRALAAAELEKLRKEAPALVRASTEKILKFVQPDGAFEFELDSGKSYESQGVPVSVPGIEESNVNATVICTSGLVGHIYAALDISDLDVPIFGASDMQRFLDIINELSPVVKKEFEYTIEYNDFEYDEIGKEPLDVKITNNSSGSIKVVKRGDGKALSIDSKKGGGDSVDIAVGQNIINPKCFVFESDICLNSADREGALGELSLLDNGANIIYMLYFINENGKVKFSDSSSVLEDKRVMTDLGEFASLGTWFNLKVEYYLGDHDSFRVKIYLNGNLIAVSDNYYDRNGLKLDGGIGTPRQKYYSTRLSVFSYVEAEVLIDNSVSYHANTPYEIPANTSSLRCNVDYTDYGEKKYTFEGDDLGDIQASGNAAASGGVLNMLGTSEIVIPVNIRQTKANCVSLSLDIIPSRIASNATLTLKFIERTNSSAPLSGIAFAVRTENQKTLIDLYDMPSGNLGSVIYTLEADADGVFSLRVDYYDSMAATLIYIDSQLVAMTNSASNGAALKRCGAVTLSSNSALDAGLDNIIAEKTVKYYLDAIRPENDEKVYDFSYSDSAVETNGQIDSGVLTLDSGEYVKIPVTRRGVAFNMICVEAEIELTSYSNNDGYRITVLDAEGKKLIEYVALRNGTYIYIYESTESTTEPLALIGSYPRSGASNIKIEFFFREETANVYIDGYCVGISSSVYNSSAAMTEPAFVAIAALGSASVELDNAKCELNYKSFEKEAQVFDDNGDETVFEFESSTTGNLPERLTATLKSATASIRIQELYCKQKFTHVLRFASGAGANDSIKLEAYGGSESVNSQKLAFDACIDATAPYDTFRFCIGNSVSEYAYAFEVSAAYGDVLLSISTTNLGTSSQAARYTIAKEGEWFNLEILYFFSGEGSGHMKIFVNGGYVAELEGIYGTRVDSLTYLDFGALSIYSYSDTNAVIYLDNLDLTTMYNEYVPGAVVKVDVEDFEDGEITDDGTLTEYGYVKVNHPAALNDGTRAAFADIISDPKDAANKVLRLYSTRKSGGSGDGYPSSAISADISLTASGNNGYCYIFETRLYISSSSYNANGVVANINLNFGNSEKATSIAINLKTDSNGKKQAYLTSVYGTDKSTALYTFECDEWITLKLEFYRGKYAADNYGTIIYANGTEVARDLAWRTGLPNYQTREFAAANLFLDRYMAGCILIDDAKVYSSDKTYE